MKTVAIIGAGRLGTALGSALIKTGYTIQGISCKTIEEAQESSRIIGSGKPFEDNRKAAADSRFIIIAVPDDSILDVAAELAEGVSDWGEKLVWHCSGILTSSALVSLQYRKALSASVHPVKSFAEKVNDPGIFHGIHFSLEGEDKAFGLSKNIVQALGGIPFRIQAEDKPLYHAACSIASNFSLVLLESAAYLLSQTKSISRPGLEILFPLLQGTLQNVNKLDIKSALTGPIQRGDTNTVAAHLNALQEFPQHQQLYLRLAEQTLKMVKQEGELEQPALAALTRLLEGK